MTTAAIHPAPGPLSPFPEEADNGFEGDDVDDVADDVRDDVGDEDELGSLQVGLHFSSKRLTQSL